MLANPHFPSCLQLGRCGWRCLSTWFGAKDDDARSWVGGQNGFLFLVLKHGPRSLTFVRVQECQTLVRNESDSGCIFLHSPPAAIPRENGLSVSMYVGTRKMVNYA